MWTKIAVRCGVNSIISYHRWYSNYL